MNKPMTVAVLLQMADVVLTLLVVEGGGLGRELNPVVRDLLRFGWWGIVAFIGLKVATMALLVYMYTLPGKRLVVLLWWFAAYYVLLLSTAALVWNLGQLLL